MQTEQSDRIAESFRAAYGAIVEATPEPLDEIVWKVRPVPQPKQFRLGWIMGIGVSLVIALSTAVVISQSFDQPNPSLERPSISSDSPQVPNDVQEYWGMNGQLLAIGSEAAWICPARPSSGFSTSVSSDVIPNELRFNLAGFENQSVSQTVYNYGPRCEQPALVALASSLDLNDGRSIIIFPAPDVEGGCIGPDLMCSSIGKMEDVLVGGSEGEASLSSEFNFILLKWNTSNGYPLQAAAFGMELGEVTEIAELVEVDGDGNLRNLPSGSLNGMEIYEPRTSRGVWKSDIVNAKVYEINDQSIQVSTRFRESFSVFQFPNSEIIELDGSLAVWLEGAGGFLMFSGPNDVVVTIEGTDNRTLAVQLAQLVEIGS